MIKFKIINYKQKKNKGVALFIAILIASIALTIGAGVLNITLKQLKLSSIGAGSTQALFSADTGLECALKWDLQPNTPGQSIFGYYSNAVAPLSGIVGWWKLNNDGAPLEAVDAFRGNNGALINGPSWVVNGKVDGALSFNGTNNYVKVPNAVDFLPKNAITIAFWQKVAEKREQFQISWNMVDGGNRFVIHAPWTDGYIYFDFGDVSSNGRISDIYPTNLIGKWAQVVAVADSSSGFMAIYINGEEMTTSYSKNPGIDLSAGGRLFIGQSGADSYYYKGDIDDIRIYDRALTLPEIKNLYDATAGKFTSPGNSPTGPYICADKDIVSNSSGFWSVSPLSNGAETTFYTENSCSKVVVRKESGKTTILSRGYNTCVASSPRRVERGIILGPF